MAENTTRRCAHCHRDVDAMEPACPACGQLVEPRRCARHPDRLANGQCIVCGDAVCQECDTDQQGHYLCPAHHEVEIVEGWAQVYTTSDDVEAGLIRDNLRAAEMDAEVYSQKDHMFAVDLGDLSQLRVLVPAYRFEEAQSVIAQYMDAAGEVAFACPSCGEPYEPGETVCAACREPLPAAPG